MTLRTLLDRFDLLMDTPESVPKLRRFILQLAIQGRLTEQEPDDEPAEVLINRIQSEKKRLYDAGEIRKPKNLDPVDTAENPFQLPESWVWTRFGTACNIIRGITFSKSDKFEQKKDGRVACLRTANVQEEVVWDDLIFVDPEFVKREEQWLRPGDTLISMSNSYELVGKVAFTNRVPQKTTIGGFLGIVRPYCCFDEAYMYHALNSPLMQQGMRQTSSQTTNIANLALRDIRPLPFPLPPLEEQQRIVEAVDQLMDECDALEQQQERERSLQVQVGTAATEALQAADNAETLRPAWERVRQHFDTVSVTPEGVDSLRQAILQLAVRGWLSERKASDESAHVLLEQMEVHKERLDEAGEYKYQKTMPPIEENDIPFSFSLPEGWTWVRLGNLGKVYGGGTPKKSNAEYWGGNIPWVSPKDMNEAVIQSTEDQITRKGLEESSAKLVPPGSLLIVGRSGILERKLPVGVTAVECTANQDLKVLTPFVSGMARYIRLMLKGFEPYILNELVKTGTTVRSLKYTEFQLQPYPLPPLSEQKRIVEVVVRLLDLCETLESKLHSTEDLLDRLSSLAFSVDAIEPDTLTPEETTGVRGY